MRLGGRSLGMRLGGRSLGMRLGVRGLGMRPGAASDLSFLTLLKDNLSTSG